MITKLHEQETLTADDMLRQEVRNDNIPVEEPHHTNVFMPHDLNDFRQRWRDIQSSFVDEPRQSVKQADELVESVIHRLTEAFSNERSRLERDLGNDTSTEDLRQALRQYRWFFDRLLSV
jgi:hypothetical protein